MATHTQRRPSLVWPLVLIGIGLVFLFQNLGLIRWDFWLLIGRFWPVILILFGVELMLGRRQPWLAAVVVATVVVLVVGGGVLSNVLGYTGSRVWNWTPAGEARETQHVAVPIDRNILTTVDLQFGAGNLTLNSLPVDSNNLMEGDFTGYGSGEAVSRNNERFDGGRVATQSYRCRADDCTLTLRPRDHRHWPIFGDGGDSWLVSMNPRIPLNIKVQAGASRLDLDLTNLKASSLRLEVGASNGTIKLPAAAGHTKTTVKTGAADLDLVVPEGTAARIHIAGALNNPTVDEARFPRVGEVYQSADYAQAENRAEIEIDGAVTTIRVR